LLTRWRQTVPEAGLLMLALGLVLMFNLPDSGWPDKPLDERLMGNGLAAALVVGGTVWLEPWLLRLQPLRLLRLPGQAAYSIYLSHTFVVPVAVQLSQRLGLREGWVILPLVCALALLVGLASYLALERPMRRGLKRLIFKPSPPAPTALPSTTSAPHGSERSHAQ
jgi:peptidoglycan/LPS O-acetylase OafA/YrhL